MRGCVMLHANFNGAGTAGGGFFYFLSTTHEEEAGGSADGQAVALEVMNQE